MTENEELVAGMHKELVKNAASQDRDGVEKAVDYLNSAIDIFEDAGMQVQADQVLRILFKIADDANDAKKKSKDPRKLNDPHIRGLTPEKQIANLKHHGTVFNMTDDGQDNNDLEELDNASADDLLSLDISDGAMEVSEKDLHPGTEDFEDERD